MATPGNLGNNAEMPFLDHLEELRWRIIWSLVGPDRRCGRGVLCPAAVRHLQVPRAAHSAVPRGNKLKYTHPADPFSVLISASFTIGIVIALPVILYQVWAFLAPALYKHEKRVVLPVIFGAIAAVRSRRLAVVLRRAAARHWLADEDRGQHGRARAHDHVPRRTSASR
jgi:Sec-independent protein secretion pathway component TatC